MTQLLNVFLYTLHFIISLFLILVVLLQQGKGADLSVFGGGASQAAFGARGAATVLHKATVVGFVLFIMTTLTIGVVQSRSHTSVVGGIGAVEASEPASDLTAPAGGELPAEEPAAAATDGVDGVDGESAEGDDSEPVAGEGESPAETGETGDASAEAGPPAEHG